MIASTFSRLGSLFMTAPIWCPAPILPNMGGGFAPDSPHWGGANPVRPRFAPGSPHRGGANPVDHTSVVYGGVINRDAEKG